MANWMLIALFPAIFLGLLFFLPNGIWKLGEALKSNDSIKFDAESQRRVEVQLIRDNLIGNIDRNAPFLDGQYQSDKIYKAIQYVISRHDWYESQRTIILGYVLTIGSLVFGGIAAYIATQKDGIGDSARVIVASTGLVMLIGIGYIVHLYNRELDQDRPYRLVVDIKHWYFRYSFPGKTTRFGRRAAVAAKARDVLGQKQNFAQRIAGTFDLSSSIQEDIEQLFILHILVKHKSESLQKMRSTFTDLVLLLVASVVFFFFYYGYSRC